MGTFTKPGSAEQDSKWAWIWFKKFSAFHGREGENQRVFTAEEVIAFLKRKRDAGVPAWKRMKIIEGLIHYRRSVQQLGVDDNTVIASCT